MMGANKQHLVSFKGLWGLGNDPLFSLGGFWDDLRLQRARFPPSGWPAYTITPGRRRVSRGFYRDRGRELNFLQSKGWGPRLSLMDH